jgi:hypothetical protein
VSKAHLRIQAYGTVDETNATLGIVRLHTATPDMEKLDQMLARIQNELFDLGADLCVPDTGKDLGYEPLRILPRQFERIETEIDDLNGELSPLRSYVLPGGHPAAAPAGDRADPCHVRPLPRSRFARRNEQRVLDACRLGPAHGRLQPDASAVAGQRRPLGAGVGRTPRRQCALDGGVLHAPGF